MIKDIIFIKQNYPAKLYIMSTTQSPIQWTRIDNDTNGNPRYVCSWLSFNTTTYAQALKIAHTIGWRKYHNKKYGGGIAFQSYNIQATEQKILELINKL